MKYTNKFVEFLNGTNTIKVSGVRDFNSLKALLKRVGLEMISNNYYDLLELARLNHCAIDLSILVEYQPFKGLTIGYRSYEESVKWYGINPWSVPEVMQSIGQ